MIAENNKGYPREWFVDAHEDGSEFVCGVCHDVLNNPRGCRNGHWFCLACITQALETSRQCPLCKVALKAGQLTDGRVLKSLIGKMTVKCNHSSRCNWTGSLQQKQSHLDEQCTFELLTCSLYEIECCVIEGCKGKVSRKNWSDHIFVSKERSIEQVCSLAEKISTLRDESQATYTAMDGFKKDVKALHVELKEMTDQNKTKQTEIDNLKKENKALQNKILPNYESKMINGDTVFSGKLPAAEDDRHFGVLTYMNGNTYQGEMVNYIADGEGVEKQVNGLCYYTGTWLKGKFTFGIKKFNTGALIVGYFKNRVAHGVAKWTSADGSQTYEGEYVNGERHGSGNYKSSNFIYEGQFAHNKCHGKGIQTLVSGGHTISGEWDMGQRVVTAPAMYTWPRGGPLWKFEGVFAGEVATGNGVLTFSDGRVFTGDVVDGKMHGAGSLKLLDGTVETGVWKYNEKEC